jgi:hypothetical protein
VWYWRYGEHDLYYDIGEEIRFKAVHFNMGKTGENFQ